MSADETKERILDAAERLFAERGFDATSLRSVTAAAGANLAAVNYHFGSKAALLPAVVARILEPVSRRQLERLDELEARERRPSVDELLDALVGPISDFFAEGGDRGPVLARMFARIMGDPGDEMRREAMERVQEVNSRFQAAFAHALPELDPGELWLRLRSIGPVAISAQVNVHAAPELGGPPEGAVPDHHDLLRATLVFLGAGMKAPPAAGRRAGERGLVATRP